MTTYNAEHVSVAGLIATYHAAAAGDKVKPGVTLIVKNTNAATRDLTLVTPGTAYGQAIADQAVTIPATTGEKIVKIPDVGFAGTDGLVPLAWSATAGVTFAVLDVD
jgi:hypothetical protein